MKRTLGTDSEATVGALLVVVFVVLACGVLLFWTESTAEDFIRYDFYRSDSLSVRDSLACYRTSVDSESSDRRGLLDRLRVEDDPERSSMLVLDELRLHSSSPPPPFLCLALDCLGSFFSRPMLSPEVSFYGGAFQGRPTAGGELFDCRERTAASPCLPFGSVLLVRAGDRWTTVRINDRGPYDVDSLGRAIFPLRPHPRRHLDLSRAAFVDLIECEADSLRIGILRSVEYWRVE